MWKCRPIISSIHTRSLSRYIQFVFKECYIIFYETNTERHAVLDALFGTNGLITCNDIVSFDSFVTQMQSKELLNVPTAFSDYVLCRIFSTNATKLNVWQQLLDK